MKLTAMQIAEAKKCKTPEEVVEKAKAHGIEMTLEEAKEALGAPAMMELNDDDLAAVSGGCGGGSNSEHLSSVPCGHCPATADYSFTNSNDSNRHYYNCASCGYHTLYIGKNYSRTYSPGEWAAADD